MIKLIELDEPKSCFNRALDSEPIFVLLGRDSCAAATIRHWCELRINTGKNQLESSQIQEALKLASDIDSYASKWSHIPPHLKRTS